MPEGGPPGACALAGRRRRRGPRGDVGHPADRPSRRDRRSEPSVSRRRSVRPARTSKTSSRPAIALRSTARRAWRAASPGSGWPLRESTGSRRHVDRSSRAACPPSSPWSVWSASAAPASRSRASSDEANRPARLGRAERAAVRLRRGAHAHLPAARCEARGGRRRSARAKRRERRRRARTDRRRHRRRLSSPRVGDPVRLLRDHHVRGPVLGAVRLLHEQVHRARRVLLREDQQRHVPVGRLDLPLTATAPVVGRATGWSVQ